LKEWFLYVVECADGSLYTGITTDISRRIYEHNNTKKGAKYTRSRRPVKLVHKAKFCDRSHAAKAEAGFKKLSRKEKLNQVKGQACK
jgi:putative endonuclease